MPKRRDWMIDIIGPHIPPADRIMKKYGISATLNFTC
jgi:hypothetical protein